MNKKNILRQLLAEKAAHTFKQVILYGNPKSVRDIDLLVIHSEAGDFQTRTIGNLDVLLIAESQVPLMLKYLDPMITEPILNGLTIWGRNILPCADKLRKRKGNHEVALYILRSARTFLEWSIIHFRSGNLRESAQCLAFVVSHCMFAKTYKKKNRVATFKEIQIDHISELFNSVVSVPKNSTDPTPQCVLQLIHGVAKELELTYKLCIRTGLAT